MLLGFLGENLIILGWTRRFKTFQGRYHLVLWLQNTSRLFFAFSKLNIMYFRGQLWSWLYGSWIYNYLCNRCLSPLRFWVRTLFMARCTRYKVCQWLATGQWFSSGTPIFTTNKTDRQDIAEILFKVVLNTISLTLNPPNYANFPHTTISIYTIHFFGLRILEYLFVCLFVYTDLYDFHHKCL